MADELVVSLRIKAVKTTAEIDDDFADGSILVTMTGTERVDNYQIIGFAEAEALLIGDVATAGWCHLKNLDTANFVTVRMGASGADVVKMKAGEPACFRLAGNTPYALADTAACRLRVRVFED